MFVLFAALFVSTLASGRETWTEALHSRNYAKAAQLLHPIIADPTYNLGSRDPEPARALARLYAQGLGVPRDPIGACSIAQMAEAVAQRAADVSFRDAAEYDAKLAENKRLTAEHCGGLSSADQRSANLAAGCYALGMREEVIPMAGQLVQIGRAGIGLLDAPDGTIVGLLNCPMFIARVRTRSVEPPAGASPGVKTRHFIEVWSWGGDTTGKPEEAARYSLRWHVYEVLADRVVVSGVADLQSVADWPSSPVVADADTDVAFEMIRTGQVRWEISGGDVKRGWLQGPY